MPGWITNGMPPIGAAVQNGVTVSANPINVNGTLSGGEALTYSNLGVSALLPVDTELSSGGTPQTVAATAFQIASIAAELFANTATSTVHAATLNTVAGLITTEALTTAAGGTYTFTLTNSLLVAGAAAPQIQIRSGTNTGGGFTVTSVTNATGSCAIVITNSGTTALNGTILIAFHV